MVSPFRLGIDDRPRLSSTLCRFQAYKQCASRLELAAHEGREALRLFHAGCQVDRLVGRRQIAIIEMARNHVDVHVKDVLAGQLVVLPEGRAGCVEGVLDCLSRPADTTEELGVECPRKVVQVAESNDA